MSFHYQGGWYFERITQRPDRSDDGTVRIYHEYITEMGEHKQDFQLIIDADSWASIVASVSQNGEEDRRFYDAKKFHMKSTVPVSHTFRKV